MSMKKNPLRILVSKEIQILDWYLSITFIVQIYHLKKLKILFYKYPCCLIKYILRIPKEQYFNTLHITKSFPPTRSTRLMNAYWLPTSDTVS